MKRLRNTTLKRKIGRGVLQEAAQYGVEPLDPWLMCGPDTSVRELWRVRENRGTEVKFHLVFYDRYGWYCEHGRSCAAVQEARRAVREMSAMGALRRERTGRPRARNKR